MILSKVLVHKKIELSKVPLKKYYIKSINYIKNKIWFLKGNNGWNINKLVRRPCVQRLNKVILKNIYMFKDLMSKHEIIVFEDVLQKKKMFSKMNYNETLHLSLFFTIGYIRKNWFNCWIKVLINEFPFGF